MKTSKIGEHIVGIPLHGSIGKFVVSQILDDEFQTCSKLEYVAEDISITLAYGSLHELAAFLLHAEAKSQSKGIGKRFRPPTKDSKLETDLFNEFVDETRHSGATNEFLQA